MGNLTTPRFIKHTQGWLDFIANGLATLNKDKLLFSMLSLYTANRKPPKQKLLECKIDSAMVKAFLNKVVFKHNFAYGKQPFRRSSKAMQFFIVRSDESSVTLNVDIAAIQRTFPDLEFTPHIDAIRIDKDGTISTHFYLADVWTLANNTHLDKGKQNETGKNTKPQPQSLARNIVF